MPIGEEPFCFEQSIRIIARQTVGGPVLRLHVADDTARRLDCVQTDGESMNTQLEQQRTWFKANWKWFVPILLGVPLVVAVSGFVITVLVVMGQLKSTEVYQLSLVAVREHEEVRQLIGTPMDPSWIVQGQIKTETHNSQTTGYAEVMYSVKGPNGGAGVRGWAKIDEQGQWQLLYVDAGVKVGNRDKFIRVIDEERPIWLK